MKKTLKEIWELSGTFLVVFLIITIGLAVTAAAAAFVVRIFTWTYNLLS